jgi:serine/threonine-protein kinase
MALRLKIIAGPDQGKSFAIPFAGTLTVGRGSDANIELTDTCVSRRHFQLIAVGGQVRLIDLGSRAGTLVNNTRVNAEQPLRPGDIIVAADTYLQVVADAASTPGAAPRQAAAPTPPPPTAARTPAASRANPVARGATAAAPAPTQPVTPQSLARLVNTTLGPFAIGPVPGFGKTGTVFRALDTRDRSEVALKVFLPGFSRDDEELQRFTRAARTIIPLRHAHLVDLLGAGRVGTHCWLSMELVEGPSVAWVVQQTVMGQADWRVGQRVLLEVARALVYLHGKGVLHRNLTPENLLMSRADGLIKVGDLITAKAQEGKFAQDVTAEGKLVGNVLYLAPERAEGDPQAGDARSDLYSLGAVVYAVLTGRPPIEGNNPVDTAQKIRETLPVPVRIIQSNIPLRLEMTVMRLLSKNPDDRFGDAGEVLRYFDGLPTRPAGN